jgi:hypothetical protein
VKRIRACGWAVALAALFACSSKPSPAAERHEPLPPAPRAIPDAGDWGARVGSPPRALAQAAPVAREPRAAVMSDDAEAKDDPTFVGRLVYRVRFVVPPSFRDYRASVEAPAGELHVDVSMSRLRARFIGPGWPIDEGTEIRLRADLPGVYLFDGLGGRSLGAGQLAGWFEGRETGRTAETMVGIRRDYGPPADRPMPGELLCALLAEWSHQRREALVHRCTSEALPPGFRLGPWSGELTAVVPMELPRRNLRADEVGPPAPIATRGARALLEPDTLAKLVPSRAVEAPGPAALTVENRTDTRAIVIAQGVAVGWIDAGQSLRIEGFTPGFYRIGAVRPLGVMRMPPRILRVPGDLVISSVPRD